MGFVADIVSGAVDAVGSVIDTVGSSILSAAPSILGYAVGGPIGGAIGGALGAEVSGGNALLGGITGGFSGGMGNLFGSGAGAVVYDASGMAIDAAAVASGATELAGGIAYDAAGNALGDAIQVATQAASNSGGLFGNLFGTNSILPGESGGMPTGPGGILGSGASLGNLAKVGMNLYSAFNVPSGQSPKQAQNAASPYSPYAGQAAAQLNQLVANPSSVMSSAGYQSGLQAQQQGLSRQLAQTGQSQSGLAGYSAALSAGDYFNNYYNQQFNKLAQLAGATPQNLVAGQAASQQAAIQQQNAKATQMQYLNAAFGGMFGGQQQQTSYWG